MLKEVVHDLFCPGHRLPSEPNWVAHHVSSSPKKEKVPHDTSIGVGVDSEILVVRIFSKKKKNSL